MYIKRSLSNKNAISSFLIFAVVAISVYNFVNNFPTIPKSVCINAQRNIQGDNPVKFADFRIIVLTFNRPANLRKLLGSLNRAVYDNDIVVVDIWIDVPKNGTVDTKVLELASGFKFTHGVKTVNVHKEHVGIIGQWIYTWKKPENDKEIALILEDDITVSPYFYKYLKAVHRKYGDLSFINGFSLQGESMRHGEKGPLNVSKQHRVFLYPTLGTWGFSPNADNWFKFVDWFTETCKDQTFLPVVNGNIASSWYLSFVEKGTHDSMWEMWHIYYTWIYRENIMYPNFEDQRGLTFNWKAAGLHYDSTYQLPEGTDRDFLVQEWDEDFQAKLPENLPMTDNRGRIHGFVMIPSLI